MLHLEVLVPEARNSTAVVTLSDGTGKIREDAGVASAAPRLAAAHDNPDCSPLRPGGHPPFGAYLLLKRASAPEGCAIEYGTEMLLFEAQNGQALEAESFGRLALLVYSGPTGKDALLRRTQGGVRLSSPMMSEIVFRLARGGDIDLRIGPLDEAPAWWQFWKRRHVMRPLPLSSEPPHLAAPPLDEVSLMSALLQGTHTRRRSRSDTQPDDDRDRYRSDSSSSGGGSGSEPFHGRGGEYAGAGASSSWGDAPAGSGRPLGVDGSGRIIDASTAAGIAAAAVAGAVAGSDGAADVPSSSPVESGDTGTRSDTSY